jgi:hypothetical protein
MLVVDVRMRVVIGVVIVFSSGCRYVVESFARGPPPFAV